ncbi:hypothetical protein [Thiolapillus brandeum]|uniref:Lipoprotein n=1 Tax=Thiolapillus brandeum TaxID=1076588 RepID=A0A7U6JHF7_9GAMM|nr:hypothetical protein [Thiolapillus brandeum]BAO43732.1 hypothetical protein TBH_C0796 [Thiolapillus brandeum]
MSQRLILIAAASLVALTLSGCNDEYYNDGGYSGGGGYGDYDAPRKDLVANCKGKIREKVRNRLGYGAKIEWGKYDMYNSARHETTINGKGKARNNGRKHKLVYTCRMNRRDAWVRSAHIELDNDSGDSHSGNWDQQAIRACKDRIRYQTSRNIHQQFSLNFTRQHVSTPAERRRHVTGEAVLQGRNGKGRISYDCKLHVNPLRLDNAGYRWLKPLPGAGTGGNGSYQPGITNKDAKHRCQKNLKNRLKLFGYHKIRFPGSSVRDIGNNRKQVDISVNAITEDGGSIRESYRCRINSRNGKVLDMNKMH